MKTCFMLFFGIVILSHSLAQVSPETDHALYPTEQDLVHSTATDNTEDYAHLVENKYNSPLHHPLSTFSIDADQASFANIRRYLDDNSLPPPEAVRIEEMINYFDYEFPEPKDERPLSVSTELAVSPWSGNSLLMQIGVRGNSADLRQNTPANLVLLVDLSSNMDYINKLSLAKTSLHLLVDQLQPSDRISIVGFSESAWLVLPPTPVSEKNTILKAIGSLQAKGRSNGMAGIRLAYQVAKDSFQESGINRIVLTTDGDFNYGISSDGALGRLVMKEREKGVYLSIFGFGTQNLKDNKLELLADRGNGHYAYIDNVLEAKKAIIRELSGTILPVAEEVKIQVEFNPEIVSHYRLIGYENRLLKEEDFNNDAMDAGEIGGGRTATALYEIIPVSSNIDIAGNNVDSLRYQMRTTNPMVAGSGEILYVKLRYQVRGIAASHLITIPVEHRWQSFQEASTNLRWASTVAGFGMLLRESPYSGNLTFERLHDMGSRATGKNKYGYRSDFLQMIESAELLSRLSLGNVSE